MSLRQAHLRYARVWPLLASPRTAAVRRALARVSERSAAEDLLFLEVWEREAPPDVAAALRARQIRRANPGLVAELRAELRSGRPLTARQRARLMARVP